MIDPTTIGTAALTLAGVIGSVVKNNRINAKRLARFEADSKVREEACIQRLQAFEDQRRTDANDVISRNTSVMSDNSASNRELTTAVNRLVVAVATMPGQDGERRMRDINRQAADLTPQSTPFVPEKS